MNVDVRFITDKRSNRREFKFNGPRNDNLIIEKFRKINCLTTIQVTV